MPLQGLRNDSVCMFQGLVQIREAWDEVLNAGEGEDAEHEGVGGE